MFTIIIGIITIIGWFSHWTSENAVNKDQGGFLQNLLPASLPYDYSGYCPKSKPRCNVLVVVDMQNDYC